MLEFVIYYICVIIFLSAAICGMLWSFVYWTLSERAIFLSAIVSVFGLFGMMMWVYWYRTKLCSEGFFHYVGIFVLYFVAAFCYVLGEYYLRKHHKDCNKDAAEPLNQSNYQDMKNLFLSVRICGRTRIASLAAYFVGMVLCYALGVTLIVALMVFVAIFLLDYVWLCKHKFWYLL